MPTDEQRAAGHERRDLNARWVALTALGMTIAAVIIHLGLAGLQAWFHHLAGGSAPVTATPPIWVGERALQQRYVADHALDLSRYRWVDRKAGVVQLPIDRAMALVAQRGIQWRQDEAP